MSLNNGYPSPTTHARELPVCGRCPSCHPGKNWGGDENCRALKDYRPWRRDCACHRRQS